MFVSDCHTDAVKKERYSSTSFQDFFHLSPVILHKQIIFSLRISSIKNGHYYKGIKAFALKCSEGGKSQSSDSIGNEDGHLAKKKRPDQASTDVQRAVLNKNKFAKYRKTNQKE